MSNVSQWSTTAASNNASPPNGWPENMARASVNDAAREMMAAVAKWFLDTDGSLTSAGGTTAYTLTTNNSNAALADISLLVFRVNATNTGACTLAVDGLAAKAWEKPGGVALASGDIVADQIVATIYNPNDDRFEVIGAAPALNLNGLTTETAIATGDLLAFVDASDSNASEKITVANFLTIINGLTQETTIDPDADFLPMYDASASAVDKVTPDAINNWVPIEPITTASSSSVLDITLDNDTYDTFVLEIRNLLVATDGDTLFFRTRQDGGGSFDTGASDYRWTYDGRQTSGVTGTSDTADSEIQATPALEATSTIGLSGTVFIHNANVALPTVIEGRLAFEPQSGNWGFVNFAGVRDSGTKTDGIRLLPSTDVFASGDVVLYGIRDPR